MMCGNDTFCSFIQTDLAWNFINLFINIDVFSTYLL